MKRLLEIIGDRNIKNIRFWCGAGISIDAPCCLPSGDGLSNQIFEEYMIYNKTISDKWNKCNEIICKYLPVNKTIRPEVMVSCINRIKEVKTTRDFYKRFGQISSIKHNYNHYVLALFFGAGGIIYTTNFDTCIEEAYKDIYHQPLEKRRLCHGKVIVYLAQNGGAVYHLHGTFEYGEEAGASIESVMTGFDQDTLRIIKSSFANKNINIFLGYSFSDDYDLNSLFGHYAAGNKNIFVCNHNGIDRTLNYKVKEICGDNSVILEENTNQVILHILRKLHINYKEKNQIDLGAPVDWRQFLSYPMQYSSQYKMLYTIELLNEIHISYKVIDRALFNNFRMLEPNIRKEAIKVIDILSYNLIANSARRVGLKRHFLKSDFLKQALGNRLNNNLFSLQKNVKKRKLNKQLRQIYVRLKQGEKLTNQDHEVIATYMRIQMVCQILGGKMKAQRLLEAVNEQTCKLEYNQGEEIYMFAARLRYKYLLGHQEDDWKEALRIYYDVGNIEGVISLLIAKSVIKSVETKIRISYIPEWKDAYALIRETGNIKYQGKCKFLWAVDGLKHIPVIGDWLCKRTFSLSEKIYGCC